MIHQSVVPPEAVAERHAEVMQAHKRAKRREMAWGPIRDVLLAGAVAVIAFQGWQNGRLAAKAERKEVVYVTLRDDGTLVNNVMWSSLSAEDRKNLNVTNSLWRYVENRECLNRTSFARADIEVQAVSDGRVGREWREYVSPENKASPWHVYFDRGVAVQCSFVKLEPLSASGDSYEYTFDRWEEDQHGRTKPVRYAAQIRFRLGVYSQDPKRAWAEKATFNAPGIQVIEYPGAKPEGVSLIRETAAR